METLPSVIDQSLAPEISELFTLVTQTLAACEAVEVVDHDSFEKAGENRNLLNDLMKEVDTTRKKITAPLDAKKRQIMEFFNGPLASLLIALNHTEKGMLAYKKKIDDERAAERERIRLEAKAKEDAEKDRLATLATEALNNGKNDVAEALLVKADTFKVPEPILAPVRIPSAEVTIKTHWTYEVVDFAALPDEFKIENAKRLLEVASAGKENAQLPGVRFFFEECLAAKKR